MVGTEAVATYTRCPGAAEGGSSDAVWGVAGVMAKDILPDDPGERCRRSRLYALRAMDRLGVLGEEDLIATLASRPELRWLVDEGGARWGVLIELGRIRKPGMFDAAVEWVLSARPRTEEAKARIRLFRAGTTGLPGVEAKANRPPPNRVASSGPSFPSSAEATANRRRRPKTKNHEREGGKIMLRNTSGLIVFAMALLLAMAALYFLVV